MTTLLLPIWQNLPFHFKSDLVGYLDLKSRFNLRSCSKSDRILVDSCPLSIKTLHIQQEYNEECELEIVLYSDPTIFKMSCIDETDEDRFGNTVSVISLLLAHRHTSLNRFFVNCERHFSSAMDSFLIKILKELELRQIPLNCQKFIWDYGVPNGDTLASFLDKMNDLVSICLNFIEVAGNKHSILEKIMETEQWKKLKKIKIFELHIDNYFDHFLHVNKLKTYVRKFTDEMLEKLIKEVKTRIPPIGSQFMLSSTEAIELDKYLPEFQHFEGVHPRLALMPDTNPTRATLLIDESHCLVIIKWWRAIEATVCGNRSRDEDFEKYHGKSITIDML